MKKQIILAIFILTGIIAFAKPQDSIGMKTVDGKQYIMHKVTKGEGVYSISKKYGVSASDIYASNSGADKGIKIDQILLIPGGSKGMTSTSGAGGSATTTTSVKKVDKKYHVVAAGQTLSSLAKKFNTTVADIKKWNNLKSDNINLGQKLVVGETITYAQQTTTQQQTPKKEVEKPVKIKEEEEIVEEIVDPTDKPVAAKTESTTNTTENVVVNTDQKSTPVVATKPYVVEDGDEVTESGTGVVSTDGELGQERSFVLHPTAKVGTIIMITNPENNNAVFARVVGSCKPSNGTILYMSKTVADKLGVNGDSKLTINYAR